MLRRSLLAAFAGGPLSAALAGCDTPTQGMSRKDLVNAYIEAMQKGDKKRLTELNEPELDPADDIDRRIKTIGKRHWTNITVAWTKNPITGEISAADIAATDDAGAGISDSVPVAYVQGYWYVALGPAKPHGPLPSPSA